MNPTTPKKKRTVEEVLAQCDAWEAYVKKHGRFEVARRISKLPSYRAYVQKWPIDYTERWDTILSVEDMRDFLKDPAPPVEKEVSDRIDAQLLERRLTPKQKKIWSAYREGKDNNQIMDEQGFKTDNAVRWHKHQIKRAYAEVKATKFETLYEYICKDCVNLWTETQKGQYYCPRCDSGFTLYTGEVLKPILDL